MKFQAMEESVIVPSDLQALLCKFTQQAMQGTPYTPTEKKAMAAAMVAKRKATEWDVITPEEMAQEATYWAQRQVEADAQHEADKRFLALVDSMPENDCGL